MLAVGLAVTACRAGYLIYFTTLDDLVRRLRRGHRRVQPQLHAYLRPAVFVDEPARLPPLRTRLDHPHLIREGMAVARLKGWLRGKQPKLSAKQEAHFVGLYRAQDTIGEPKELLRVTRSRGDLCRAAGAFVVAVVWRGASSSAAGRTRARTSARSTWSAAVQPLGGSAASVMWSGCRRVVPDGPPTTKRSPIGGVPVFRSVKHDDAIASVYREVVRKRVRSATTTGSVGAAARTGARGRIQPPRRSLRHGTVLFGRARARPVTRRSCLKALLSRGSDARWSLTALRKRCVDPSNPVRQRERCWRWSVRDECSFRGSFVIALPSGSVPGVDAGCEAVRVGEASQQRGQLLALVAVQGCGDLCFVGGRDLAEGSQHIGAGGRQLQRV